MQFNNKSLSFDHKSLLTMNKIIFVTLFLQTLICIGQRQVYDYVYYLDEPVEAQPVPRQPGLRYLTNHPYTRPKSTSGGFLNKYISNAFQTKWNAQIQNRYVQFIIKGT